MQQINKKIVLRCGILVLICSYEVIWTEKKC